MAFAFNATYYLQQNPDVLNAVLAGVIPSAEYHFMNHGWKEGRDPNAVFDTTEYVILYPDVLAAGINPFVHFATFGAAEGRAPSQEYAQVAQNFDAAAYLAANSDVKAAVDAGALTAYQHFILHGQYEGRPGAQLTNGTAISTIVTLPSATTGTPGSTVTFTTGVDALNGTANNDTFVGVLDAATAANTTLNVADSVDGGNGTDTLSVISQGATANVLPAANYANVETVSVRAIGTGGLTVNANDVVAATSFVNDRSTDAVTFTNLGNSDALAIKGNGIVTNGATTFGYATAANPASVTVNGGVTAGAITVSSAATTFALASTGAANTTGAVDLSGGADVVTAATINATTNYTTTGAFGSNTELAANATLTVTGAGAVDLDAAALATDYASVDASKNTGGTHVELGAVAQTFTGGTGNDIVTNVAGVSVQTGAVNGGEGTDRVVFTANGQLTSASGAKFTNFEVLQANNGVTDIDMDNISGITTVRVNDAGGGVTITDLSATQASNVQLVGGNGGAVTLGVKGATTVGQLDTLSINATTTNTAVSVTNIVAAGVETINLAANTGTAATTVTALTHQDWATLNITGDAAVNITSAASAANVNTSVNGSAANGVLTLNFANSTTNGVALTGGSAADTLTGTAQADVINGGAGADIVVGGVGADTLTGGAGADTFRFAAGDVGTPSATNFDTITDFAKGSDIIDFAGGNITFVTNATAATGTAAINAEGIATFAAADDTLAERLVAVEAGINAGGVGAAGQAAIFEFDGSSYVFVSNGTDTVDAGDLLVKLTGVTGLTDSTINANGDLLIA